MNAIEVFQLIGSSFGYILSAVAVVTMVVKYIHRKVGGFVKKESGADLYERRLVKLEKLMEQQLEDDKSFQEKVLEMLMYQSHANKQTLANIIESTYHKNKLTKELDSIELKRIVNAYDIYHNELGGNSYITEIYTEMIDEWEHL